MRLTDLLARLAAFAERVEARRPSGRGARLLHVVTALEDLERAFPGFVVERVRPEREVVCTFQPRVSGLHKARLLVSLSDRESDVVGTTVGFEPEHGSALLSVTLLPGRRFRRVAMGAGAAEFIARVHASMDALGWTYAPPNP